MIAIGGRPTTTDATDGGVAAAIELFEPLRQKIRCAEADLSFTEKYHDQGLALRSTANAPTILPIVLPTMLTPRTSTSRTRTVA